MSHQDMSNQYRDSHYTDPFTDRPERHLYGGDHSVISTSPPPFQHDYRESSYSPSLATKDSRAGGLADDFYNTGFMAENNNLNAGAGSGKNRLSTLEEHDDHGYGLSPNKNYSDFPSNVSLVKNADEPGRGGFQDMEYADPTDVKRSGGEKKNAFTKFLASGRYPLEQRIEDKKRGIGRQRIPFVTWALTIAMTGVIIWELVRNAQEQGSPISLKPVVNPMLGPSSSALINLGARYPACMKLVKDIPPTLLQPCLNNTANPPDRFCTTEELCGFGGFHGEDPSQWFRFITPIFLHAGIIHFLLNMLGQWFLSAQIEREMGSAGFIITYFAAGIFGNVLGGNFALVGIPSVGASGAIMGTLAVTWVDLIAHWKYHYRPVRQLIFMFIELLISIAIGYIPYVDNFAHIGGFVMGLFVGIVFYPIISVTKRHRIISWTFKLAAIPLAVILFVVLTRNFYTSDPYAACTGCRYLSCIPTSSNNHCQGTGLTTVNVPAT
ncbi:hypothetical protein AGABI1DRAFT_110173 [Agaricus bisporus var. burnettii JB137-S8]|uniref:Rhomboid-type serine protease n=1 Tax=Agaricus bisporus var. burnettii (strain JB137-S8 / ATCC MYA-4627 / FGSC 10392) TaxID=597362 RepID=K5XJ57_AGABU|nr:uncharacterized protein AGABI1DRAFT_110173 [Agaricus bisporus var. burnettii JB137-S8]EKM83523.1 hypothetical protein AGABI1DRAFT_110173 [Agaricus bisporus var. burnettii JB137-S8]